jgi:hypothetical protein
LILIGLNSRARRARALEALFHLLQASLEGRKFLCFAANLLFPGVDFAVEICEGVFETEDITKLGGEGPCDGAKKRSVHDPR